MKAPIKERIVAIRYKAISDEVYHEVCDALTVFLTKAFPSDGFTAEKLNIPKVTLPATTFGDEEPDWTKVKISVDRPSRFWNAGRTRCVQFFKDCLTINLISVDGQGEWSHHNLFAFFTDMLPFVLEHGKKFSITTCSVDYQNVLDYNQLEPYIINDGKTLELARVLRGNVLGQSIDGATFTLPFIHKVSYAPDRNMTGVVSFSANLNVEIVVRQLVGNKLRVQVMFSAAGERFPGLSKDILLTYLDQMHEAVTQGFLKTFSDEIVGEVERVK